MAHSGIALQRAEFDALSDLVKHYSIPVQVVDREWPEWKYVYEQKLFAFIKAVRANHGEEAFNVRSR